METEAEWEYASQAGSDAAFYWGDDKGYKYAWRGGRGRKAYNNSNDVSHPVGQKWGNRFGLYDTIGNVWEWTWDWMGPHIMNTEKTNNPKGPESFKEVLDFLKLAKTWKGNKSIEMKKWSMGKPKFKKGGRCLKGAGYNTTINKFYFLGCQYRGGLSPEKTDECVGFRIVRGK